MLDNLKAANLTRWKAMTVNSTSVKELDKIADRLIAAKSRYQAVEKLTGVPWPVIAVIHEREASQSWMANLAQGDRWDRVSTHVPRGQGPFKSWEDAAVNALKQDGLSHWGDWTIGSTLAALEKYNGLGYMNKGKPSPYVWAKTNQYKSGKYVADGQYSATAVDTQPGCAALLDRMMRKDATIDTQYKWSGKLSNATPAAGAVVAAGGAAAAVHTWPSYTTDIGIGLGILVVIYVAYRLIKYYRNKNVVAQ